MTISKGKTHELLGLHIDFNTDKVVTIKKDKNVKETIDELSEDVRNIASTSASGSIFDIDQDSEIWSVEKQ